MEEAFGGSLNGSPSARRRSKERLQTLWPRLKSMTAPREKGFRFRHLKSQRVRDSIDPIGDRTPLDRVLNGGCEGELLQETERGS